MRRSPITRRTPLSRARLRSRPPEAPAYVSAREAVHARCRGHCELCGNRVSVSSMHAHHRRPRSGGRDDSLSNLLGMCGACHSTTHAHPAAAVEDGRIISRYDQRPPAMVPVSLRGGWFLLGDDGSRTSLPGMARLYTDTRNMQRPGDGTRT